MPRTSPVDPPPAGQGSAEAGRGPEGGDRATDLGLLALALIWGINFSVIKVGLDEIPPSAFNALRFPLASLVLWLLLRRRGPIPRPDPGDRVRVVVLGIVGHLVYQTFFILGLDGTTAGNASLILATTPVWVLLLAAALGEERPGPWVWTGVLLTVGGMGMVVLGGAGVSLDRSRRTGDLLMLGGAMVWAAYTVGGRSLVQTYGSLAVTAWTLWIGTVLLVVVGLPALPPLGRISLGAWGSVGYAGILGISVAYALWYRGVRRLGSARTSAYSNLVPVVALAVAWIWLGETPSGLQLGGAAVILGGLSLARLARRRRGAG
jgi:drug/metabolite transporter (DMT)-like permease